MTFAVRILAAFLSAAVLLVVGCGGDEGESPSTSTPSPETTVTSVPSPPTATATPPVSPLTSPAAAPSPTPEASPPTATATPPVSPLTSPAAAPSPSPEASPQAEPPYAAPIELDPGVESLAENVLLPILRPQAALELDPVALSEGMEIATPPCAALVFYLSWQVHHPYPPTDVDVEVYWMRMSGRELIGAGPSGQASSGCGEFQVVNNSDVWVTLEVRYVIGELTG